MRCLLDTHTLLWISINSDRLSARVRALLNEPGHDSYVSAATSFEIATKHRLGKMAEAAHLLIDYEQQVERAGLRFLPITSVHARSAGEFPQAHKDPFDRILAAQSKVEGLTLLSADTKLDIFGINRVW